MKLRFDDSLGHQLEAVRSVVDLFKGQESLNSKLALNLPNHAFTEQEGYLGISGSQFGVGNQLWLSNESIRENLVLVQARNGIAATDKLLSRDFAVEMETGTGKTYVYIRTIFELSRHYGFTKFVIVVPSIAIKEGTNKTLEITRDHFERLYPTAKGYEFFQYDSLKPSQIQNFATSSNIQIMVITVGAINKKSINNMYKRNENTGDEKPIDLIRAVCPIVIVDEPQSVDGGLSGKGKEALKEMNPLCTLRYSATHLLKENMIYRLDAVDAYNKGLVKQIEIASTEVDSGYNKPYVKLIEARNLRTQVVAKIEIHVQRVMGVQPEIVSVNDGDDLERLSRRKIYQNMRIGQITCGKGKESIQICAPGVDMIIRPGEIFGGAGSDDLSRLMIRRTISEHFEKELRFLNLGLPIKTLSLFFIDRVENYRQYDRQGNRQPGKYATFFEEEYEKLSKKEEYKTLFSRNPDKANASDAHGGYFSIDKKARWVDTVENNEASRESAERAYNLIMKDKEQLLSFDTNLRFIFSHSALREGWDNPNVFQICALRDFGTETARRQTIGRGLRLCVDQSGMRVNQPGINTLTVIASERFESYVENLQREIEEDTGIRFGMVEPQRFANCQAMDSTGNLVALGIDGSENIWNFLKSQGYIDYKGQIESSLHKELENGTLALPEQFESYRIPVVDALKKAAGKIEIRSADRKREVELNKEVFLGGEFKELWDRIKHKTVYQAKFDNEKLVSDAAELIQESPPLGKSMLVFKKEGIKIDYMGISSGGNSKTTYAEINESDIDLPDIVTAVQEKTQLTRGSIVKILLESNRLNDFLKNPQKFIELVIGGIEMVKRSILADGVKYKKSRDGDFYVQELFQREELIGYLGNMLESKKSVYKHVIYDSISIEKGFAENLESNTSVRVYTKLPSWFKIPTPLGSYNPDWAVLVKAGNESNVYFVVETKPSMHLPDLRSDERAKIECAKQHFREISTVDKPVQYIVARDIDDLMNHARGRDD